MEIFFCRRCGSKLNSINTHSLSCDKGHVIFANPAPTVGLFLLTDNDEIILSVRGIEPDPGMLDSFGGFLDGEETFEQALKRELKEEIDLSPEDYTKPTYLTSENGSYTYRGETITVISSLFWAKIINEKNIRPMDDVAAVKKLKIKDVDIEDIAGEDIKKAFIKLKELKDPL